MKLFTSVLVATCVLIVFFAGPATPRVFEPNQHQIAVQRRHDLDERQQLMEDPPTMKFIRRCLSTAWNKNLIDDDDYDEQLVVNKQFVFGQEENELCMFLKGKHAVKY